MKMRISNFRRLLLLANCWFPAAAFAASFPATSNQDSITSALGQAHDGDTVVVASGSSPTFTSTITLSKGVAIVGAGPGKTIINGPPRAAAFSINATSVGSSFPRVGGMTIQYPSANVPGDGQGYINFAGKTHGFRVDHVEFLITPEPTALVGGYVVCEKQGSEVWGVFDHCFFSRWIHGESIKTDEEGWGGKSLGDGSWVDSSYWGDPDHAMYFEDCISEIAFYSWTMLDGGGRRAVRYSYIRNSMSSAHGADSGTQSGGRHMEWYNNYSEYMTTDAFKSGGGDMTAGRSCTIGEWCNRGTNVKNLVRVSAYRLWLNTKLYGICDGINPLDKNMKGAVNDALGSSMSPVTVDSTAGAGDIYASGTYTGAALGDVGEGSPITLIPGTGVQVAGGSSSSLGSDNRWEGFIFVNKSLRQRWIDNVDRTKKRWSASITRFNGGTNSSTSTTVRITGNGGYSGNTFELRNGDQWEIRGLDRALHQSGSGKNAQLMESKLDASQPYGGSINTVSGTQSWPIEQDGATGDGGMWFWDNKIRSNSSGSYVSADHLTGNDPNAPTVQGSIAVQDGPRNFKLNRDVFIPSDPTQTAQRPQGLPYTSTSSGDPRRRIGPDNDAWNTFIPLHPELTNVSIAPGSADAASGVWGAPYPYHLVSGTLSPPMITSAPTTTFVVGVSGQTFQVATANFSGSPGIAETGTLPTGVTFTDNTNGTATIACAGTCGSAAVADYLLTITATYTPPTPDEVATQSFNLKVVSPNAPPTCSITAPANNATFVTTDTVNITATAGDPDGTIAKVEFYSNNTLLGTDTSTPYTFAWTSASTPPLSAGPHALTVKAYDNVGIATTSGTVNINVGIASTGPPPAPSLILIKQ